MRALTQSAINNITDVFTGADGGAQFTNFRTLIENMDKQAENGDEAAKQVLDILFKFQRLVNITPSTLIFSDK